MAGEEKLSTLISSMSPCLNHDDYVFSTIDDQLLLTELVTRGQLKGFFNEKEGMTVIVDTVTAEEYAIGYEGTYNCITLNVHSSLDAVGLTAVVSTALADHGISANVVAAYYHDHIFVATNHAEQALKVLESLSVTGVVAANV